MPYDPPDPNGSPPSALISTPEKPRYYDAVVDGRVVQPIDIIEALGLGFRIGNALKYLWRAGRKDPDALIADLRKARWYIDREITALEAKVSEKPQGVGDIPAGMAPDRRW